MKTISFQKYQGTGNDFIMIDDRNDSWKKYLSQPKISQLCDRHFGIGADGLILLRQHEKYDFAMNYYNSDGNESTMCGNGGRCLVALAHALGVFDKHCTFEAIDGLHTASLEDNQVSLGMKDVEVGLRRSDDRYFLDTGSPHLVEFLINSDKVDFYKRGKELRLDHQFKPGGTNVNFVSILGDHKIRVTTYERGVENLTLSCGTGVVASVIAYAEKVNLNVVNITVETDGGVLQVTCKKDGNMYKDVVLQGPVQRVFSGAVLI